MFERHRGCFRAPARRILRLAASALALSGAACTDAAIDGNGTVGDAGVDEGGGRATDVADASSEDAATCPAPVGLEGACSYGSCDDVSTSAQCLGGRWVCPEGTSPSTPCLDGGTPPADARASDSAREAAACCPIETPSCDCFGIGGSPGTDGYGCLKICDAIPVSWEDGVDSNGCPVLVAKADAGSCIVAPGPDR